jgi:hypothetical protein
MIDLEQEITTILQNMRTTRPKTLLHIPEILNLQQHRYEKLESLIFLRLWWNTGDRVNPNYPEKIPSQPTSSVEGPATNLPKHGTNFSDSELRMLSGQISDHLA